MPAPIPDYSKVSLLLPMSGANNGTVFTDYSPTSKAVTRAGAVTSTSQSKYYGSSGYFDGSADYLTLVNSTEFDIVGADFTVCAWVYPSTVTKLMYLARHRHTGGYQNGGWLFAVNASGQLFFSFGTGSAETLIHVQDDPSPVSITLNQWQHVAITKSGTTFRIFLGGSIVRSASSANSPAAGNDLLYIGTDPSNAARDWFGYVQDLVIIKGAALWTASFTPPTRLIGSIQVETRDEVGALAPRKVFAVPRSYPIRVSASTTTNASGAGTLDNLPACEHSVVAVAGDDTRPDLVLRRLPT